MEQESQMNCDVPDLWLEHQQELKNFIFKRVKDRDLANDSSQEVLLKVYNFCRSKSGVKMCAAGYSRLPKIPLLTITANNQKFLIRKFPKNLKKMKILHFMKPGNI